jgi:hypothetical protein
MKEFFYLVLSNARYAVKEPIRFTSAERDLLTVDGEFYHRTATCAGSMTPDMSVAMDALRLAVESDSSAMVERSPTLDCARLTNAT